MLKYVEMNFAFFFRIFLLVFVLDTFSLASALDLPPRCQQALKEILVGRAYPNSRNLQPTSPEILIDRMKKLGLSFQVLELDPSERKYESYLERFHQAYVVTVKRGDMALGTLLLSEYDLSSSMKIYRADLSVKQEIKGEGAGAMLYALGAYVAHKVGGKMFSSLDPSPEAKDSWYRQIENAGAEVVVKPYMRSSTDVVFTFRQDLLDDGFFNVFEKSMIDSDSFLPRKKKKRKKK